MRRSLGVYCLCETVTKATTKSDKSNYLYFTFCVDRTWALNSQVEQVDEGGGSGHESLVPGIPGGPLWPGILQSRVMPSSLSDGGGMRLTRNRASSRLLDLSWPVVFSELLLDDGRSESWSKYSCISLVVLFLPIAPFYFFIIPA